MATSKWDTLYTQNVINSLNKMLPAYMRNLGHFSESVFKFVVQLKKRLYATKRKFIIHEAIAIN